MKKIWLTIAVLVSTAISAQTQTENYIKTTVYQKEVKEGQQDQVLESDKIVSINYADGLGRAKQSIAVRAGGQGQSTNILDWTDDWNVGAGGTALFNRNGQVSENQRIYDTNPFGEQSLLWKCGNDINNDADGGWNTDYIPVDKNVAYRYTVWVKRTGSQNGNTYHGTQNVNNLNGTANNNPYFMVGDMPNLNQWYLLVGVVHPHTYTGGNSGISGVYDVNGTKVKNGTDFKWRNNITTARFRSYLYYSTDINVRQYFWNPVLTQIDGNGTPINQLIAQSKPKDIITHYEYDHLGRRSKEYLPYASEETQNGAIYVDPLTELNNFYNTAKYQNTTNPYSETIFEDSPLNRPLKQAAPGLDWIAKTTGDDHTIKLDRRANTTADGIVYFKVNFTNGNTEAPSLVKVSNYAKNELLVNITKDENWKSSDYDNHTTREYTDKSGRVILKRTYNAGVAHDTYYVYDDFGNLTYVIPPKITVSNGVSTTELNELGYQYKYDRRNRLVEKKIPGKGWEYIVYNKLDQPVLTQDANQRAKSPKEWLFTKYDALGRVAYTGIIKNDQNRLTIQDSADNNTSYTQYETKQSSSSTIAGTSVYYTNNTIPGYIDKILTVNYYDNYEVGNLVTFNPANGSGTWEGMTATAEVKGLPTVSQVRVLGTDQWITTATYYDNKGRAWESHIKNDYLGAEDWILNKLDFVGKVLKTQTTHIKGNNAAIVTIDIFSYDHMGRLVTQKQQINDFAEELITHNVYDDLGQLESKKVGNAEQAPLQTVDYAYNVRGWLTDINDVDNIGDDLFTFKINYNDVEGYYNVPKLYNGNISQTIWKTANDNVKRSYSYQYDDLNRITSANSLKGSTLMSGDAYSMWGIAYDKNGNIGRITRNGRPGGGAIKTIDELYYTYSNNQLLKVREAITSSYKNEGFKDGTNTNDDYVYDSNGNMTIDRNKGISSIAYNHLNLPNTVAISNSEGTGNITYIYDATGAKQKKVVSGGSSLTTEYAGNYIYKNGTLEFMSHPEGYIEPNGTNGYDYVYQLKDHLGNIRLSFSDKDNDGKIDVLRNDTDVDGDGDLAMEILEEKNYYPFGLQHKGYNNTITGRKHEYGYADKELEEDLGLNTIAYGQRDYDPAIGRFNKIDRFAEKYHSETPYHFTKNNPLIYREIQGDSVWIFTEAVRKEIAGVNVTVGRHAFLRVQTDKQDVIVELWGPTDPSTGEQTRTGIPRVDSFSWDNVNGRSSVSSGTLIEPKGNNDNFEFENSIIEFANIFNNSETRTSEGKLDFTELPNYNAFGPNSNGFVNSLVKNAGGVNLDFPSSGIGAGNTEFYDRAVNNYMLTQLRDNVCNSSNCSQQTLDNLDSLIQQNIDDQRTSQNNN
ncbi:DUF6443 domain-containing protein [uncultured Aquimarina sp.]|uniref:DUF6443 domain-containing protein n=1 Tax=uncultured Aquimarina sp. TaxID=575652 RepID=UPI002606E61D|nr:DUF6443 domain-containing protein [uncultured Aquimarina sp.]